MSIWLRDGFAQCPSSADRRFSGMLLLTLTCHQLPPNNPPRNFLPGINSILPGPSALGELSSHASRYCSYVCLAGRNTLNPSARPPEPMAIAMIAPAAPPLCRYPPTGPRIRRGPLPRVGAPIIDGPRRFVFGPETESPVLSALLSSSRVIVFAPAGASGVGDIGSGLPPDPGIFGSGGAGPDIDTRGLCSTGATGVSTSPTPVTKPARCKNKRSTSCHGQSPIGSS